MSEANPNPGKPRTDYVQLLAQVLLAVMLLASVAWIVGKLAPVFAPVLLSVLIAYFLDPVIQWFEKRKVRRTPAILVVATIALVLLAQFFAFVIPAFASELSSVLEDLPAWAERTLDSGETLALRFGLEPHQVEESLSAVTDRLQNGLVELASSAVGAAASLLNIVLIPVFVFYFLRDFDSLKRKPLELIPERHHEIVVQRATRMDGIVGEWARGQIQVALVLAVLYAIGLGVVGLRMGVVIGLIAGLLNVIPYFGFAVGILLSLIMALVEGNTGQLVGVAVVFGGVQLLEQYVITPKLVGDKVGMSPVMVMIVLLVGGSLFGFFGLLLGIPAVAAGSVLAQDLAEWYRTTPWFRGEKTDKGPGHGDGPHSPPPAKPAAPPPEPIRQHVAPIASAAPAPQPLRVDEPRREVERPQQAVEPPAQPVEQPRQPTEPLDEPPLAALPPADSASDRSGETLMFAPSTRTADAIRAVTPGDDPSATHAERPSPKTQPITPLTTADLDDSPPDDS